MFKGSLGAHSIKGEQREIYLEKAKIKKYRIEKDIADEKDVGLLILGSEIKRIIVPKRSFKKHYESMEHIAQAFYIQILAIGLFFLSCSAYLTGLKLVPLLELELESFYDGLSLFFLVSTLFVLCISVWVAQKDFDKWKSFLRLSPDITFMAILFILTILSISFIMQIAHAVIPQIAHAVILIFVLLFFVLLYLYKIRPWILKPIKTCFDKIEEDFMGNKKLLGEVIDTFYRHLSRNETDKARISAIKDEILETYLFRWDSVPGHDNEKLIRFLVDDLAIDGAENATINKSSDGKIINITNKDGEHSAEIKMDDNGGKGTLLIRDDITCEFKVKTKNGNRIIYREKYKNDDKTKIKHLIENLDELKGYLFSLNLTSDNGLEADLESGSISSGTSGTFQANRHPIPNNSIIWIKEDNKWLITDRERKKIYYIARKEDGILKIYDKDKEYLETEDFNIILAFRNFVKKEDC
ncbi:hypothetical protein C5S35_18265 [Candidatus Methanophagaceae archaeon]|nr:hypothetical protein C5S35_18265 [Methanophagales archaeon]